MTPQIPNQGDRRCIGSRTHDNSHARPGRRHRATSGAGDLLLDIAVQFRPARLVLDRLLGGQRRTNRHLNAAFLALTGKAL